MTAWAFYWYIQDLYVYYNRRRTISHSPEMADEKRTLYGYQASNGHVKPFRLERAP